MRRTPATQSAEEQARQREGLLIARLLMTLFSLSIVGVNLYNLAHGFYYGRTKGGHEVVLTGAPATAMSVAIIALSGLPLALWARNGRQVLWWSLGCVLVGGVALMLSLSLR